MFKFKDMSGNYVWIDESCIVYANMLPGDPEEYEGRSYLQVAVGYPQGVATWDLDSTEEEFDKMLGIDTRPNETLGHTFISMGLKQSDLTL